MSEVHVLGIPEDGLPALLASIRCRAEIVAVFGRDGIESFASFGWMGDTDDDVLMSSFFMVVHEGRRLQHFLAPAHPVRHGPWLAVGQGDFDLEIAFGPDEGGAAAGEEHGRLGAARGGPEPVARVVEYACAIAVDARADRICLCHGVAEPPRALIEKGILSAPGFLSG